MIIWFISPIYFFYAIIDGDKTFFLIKKKYIYISSNFDHQTQMRKISEVFKITTIIFSIKVEKKSDYCKIN